MWAKQKISKGCLAGILLSALFLQAGCAFKDIDKRIFVVAIGIDPSDKVKDGFKVTLKLAKPMGDVKSAPSPSYAYISKDADSVAVAVHEMETRVDKTLDFGHSRIIVMHKELTSKDLDTFMDFFTRRGDIQMISYVAVAEKSAEEVVSFEPSVETPTSIALYNYFDDTGTESPFVVTTFLFEFRREVLGKGIDTVMPIIDIDEANQEFKVNKSIVLKWGEKPVELSANETKHYNSLVNNASGFSYKIQDEDVTMVLNLDEVSMKFKLIVDKGNPRIDMDITKVGVIGESTRRLNVGHLEKYDKFASKELTKEVMNLLTKLQESNVDPFGFGLRYRATRLSRKGLYEEWERIYPEIKFNVNMKIDLKSTGAIE